MTAAEQHRLWGVAVEAAGEQVIVQVGKELVALSPGDAQHLAFYLARAYARAGHSGRSRAGNPIITRPGERQSLPGAAR